MKRGSVGLVALLLLCARYTVAQPFSDCNIDAYYSSIDINDRSALHSLIESTHRKVLPYTSSNPDVWDALIGLDGRDTTGDGVVNEVLLLYSDIYVTAQEYGSSTTWNREHIWPKSLGVGTRGPDFTDVHHLRPANSMVNAARGNKLFGACGIVDAVQDCVSPAHAKAASDTETDNVVWLPPANRRGDVARALFYMDIRYDGGNGELDLVLTDCPSSENEMGYLSQLLAWHQEDPVDDAESARNNAVCTSWQGNRNPFIDYPQLVSVYFGDARVPNPPFGYTCNDSSTTNVTATEPPSPPPVTTDGTCNGNGLQPGSVMVTAFNSDDPDVVVLLVLSDLAPGATFYMTDNAWTGTTFRTNEGTLKFVVPESGISAGTIIGYGDASYPYADNWQVDSGSFALSVSGDNIMLYCMEEDSSITHVTALSYSGDWVSADLDESSFNTQQSALPGSLPSNTHVTLAHKDNYWYSGQRSTMSSLLEDLSHPSKWEGSNTERFHLDPVETKFLDSTSAANRCPPTFCVSIVLVVTAMVLILI